MGLKFSCELTHLSSCHCYLSFVCSSKPLPVVSGAQEAKVSAYPQHRRQEDTSTMGSACSLIVKTIKRSHSCTENNHSSGTLCIVELEQKTRIHSRHLRIFVLRNLQLSSGFLKKDMRISRNYRGKNFRGGYESCLCFRLFHSCVKLDKLCSILKSIIVTSSGIQSKPAVNDHRQNI